MTTKNDETVVHPRSVSAAARIGAGNRVSSPAPAMPSASPTGNTNGPRLTRTGKPDRRYLGQRDLPPEIVESDYTHPSTGFIDSEGRHRTQDGAPDIRFKENRMLTAEQVRLMQAQYVLAQAQK